MTFPAYQPDRPATAAHAKAMRKAMTKPEKRLWWALRHRLPDYKFRRQFVIGRFIADFCCLEGRLVIEVDGDQHGADLALERAARRTRLIEAQGFPVMRFSNRDVTTSIDAVLDTIYAALTGQLSDSGQAEGPPPLTPPRNGEGSRHA